jgi:hypothetical protein
MMQPKGHALEIPSLQNCEPNKPVLHKLLSLKYCLLAAENRLRQGASNHAAG